MTRNAITLGLAIAAALTLLAGQPAQAQESPGSLQGAVNIISPEIYLIAPDGEERRIGMPTTINAGQGLRTDESGVALVTWLLDGTEAVLGPNTQVIFDRFDGTQADGFQVALHQSAGQLRIGIGEAGAAGGASSWTVATPAFTARLMQGRFELRVSASGKSTLIVTEGSAQVAREGGAPVRVAANEFVDAAPDGALHAARLSLDGVEVALTDVCTGVANVNVNVRSAPGEASRRLGGLTEGQRFWVRAATGGQLWLQIYFRTAEDDLAAHNYGWVYGPVSTLDDAHCADLLRAPLDARIFGGPGALNQETPEPVATAVEDDDTE